MKKLQTELDIDFSSKHGLDLEQRKTLHARDLKIAKVVIKRIFPNKLDREINVTVANILSELKAKQKS